MSPYMEQRCNLGEHFHASEQNERGDRSTRHQQRQMRRAKAPIDLADPIGHEVVAAERINRARGAQNRGIGTGKRGEQTSGENQNGTQKTGDFAGYGDDRGLPTQIDDRFRHRRHRRKGPT